MRDVVRPGERATAGAEPVARVRRPARPQRAPARAGPGSTSRSAGPPASARPTWSARSPGESRLTGRDVGSIEITERFSLVEVPAGAADEVLEALRATRIKGRKVTARRDRDAPGGVRSGGRPPRKPRD